MKRALFVLLVPILAHADSPSPRRLLVGVSVTASSTYRGFAPWQAVAGSDSWCAAESPIGASITLHLDHPIAIAQVGIDNHFDTSANALPDGKFARVLEANLTTDDGRAFHLTWNDGAFFANVGGAKVRELRIAVAKVERPTGFACISQIILTEADRTPYTLFPGDDAAIDPLLALVSSLQGALASCDRTALARAVAFPIERISAGKDDMLNVKEKLDAAALATRCRAKPDDYALGTTADAAIDKLRFESPTKAEVWSGPLIWGFEKTAKGWRLRDLTQL